MNEQKISEKKGILAIDLAKTLFHVQIGNYESENDKIEKHLIDLGKQRKVYAPNLDTLSEIKSQGILTVGITGMRDANYKSIEKKILEEYENKQREQERASPIPLDYVVSEHGSIIYPYPSSGNTNDDTWEDLLREQIEFIVEKLGKKMEEDLPDEVIDKGETYIRLRPDENQGYDMRKIIETLKCRYADLSNIEPSDCLDKPAPDLPSKSLLSQTSSIKAMLSFLSFPNMSLLSQTSSMGDYECLSIIPKLSGTVNAIKHLLKKYQIFQSSEKAPDFDKVIVFGDDPNDLEMFTQASYAATFVHSKEELRDVVLRKKDKGYITGYQDPHEATNKVLSYLSNEFVPQITSVENRL